MLRRILGEFIMPTQRTRAMIELEERGLMKYQPRHLKFFPTEAGRALLDSACGRAKS
ncbi:hypothetical protein [Fulvimarina manganoxydans]|nr:hypothetical protein [Fulvimarina manganoxydans]